MIVVLIGLMVLVGSRTPVTAQDATPDAAEAGVAEGISVEVVSLGTVESFPSTPATVELYRITIDPGASASFSETDPGLGLHVVESGTLTIGRFSADVVVTRASSMATPGAHPLYGATRRQEIVPVGTDATLGPGDSFVFPPFVAGEWRNDSAEPVVLTVVLIAPAGAGAATPTP